MTLQSLTDGLGVPRRRSLMRLRQARFEVGVQRLEAVEHGDQHQEVAPRIADEPLDLALVVALARSTEPILEQVMRFQLAERLPVVCRLPSPRMRATAILVSS